MFVHLFDDGKEYRRVICGRDPQRSGLQDLKTAQKTKLLILAEMKIIPYFKIHHLLAYTQLFIRRTSDLINYVLNDNLYFSMHIYTSAAEIEYM